MATKTITIEVPEEVWEQVQKNAAAEGVRPDHVITAALGEFFAYSDEDRAAVEEGWRQADAGELIEHEDMLRWLESKRPKESEAA